MVFRNHLQLAKFKATVRNNVTKAQLSLLDSGEAATVLWINIARSAQMMNLLYIDPGNKTHTQFWGAWPCRSPRGGSLMHHSGVSRPPDINPLYLDLVEKKKGSL